ncbi:MAG: hypothetical protein RL728_653 [Bacteroidota bacterium]|jgi:hypothetical protein
MALIGSFAASSSAVFNLDFLPEYFLVGTTSSLANQSLTNLSIVTSGQQLMSVTSLARITALSKFDNGAVLDDPATPGTEPNQTAMYLRTATGRINKATTITGTNGVASARNVYAASSNISNVARRAVEQSINPSANASFDNFEALFFDATNILRAQITFANGYSDEYTPEELQALYAKYHVSDRNGTLEGLTCIDADSGAGLISQVVLFAGAGAAVVVLKSDYVQL